MDRELPVQARTWGRILDTSHMEAGDLFLTRLIAPETDRVSRAIIDSQERGGFHRRHAQWTHAAVYLGDDEYVCEANFKIPGYSNGVILRSAFFYCDGSYAIRVRRPRNMTPKQRLRIAIERCQTWVSPIVGDSSFNFLWQLIVEGVFGKKPHAARESLRGHWYAQHFTRTPLLLPYKAIRCAWGRSVPLRT